MLNPDAMARINECATFLCEREPLTDADVNARLNMIEQLQTAPGKLGWDYCFTEADPDLIMAFVHGTHDDMVYWATWLDAGAPFHYIYAELMGF